MPCLEKSLAGAIGGSAVLSTLSLKNLATISDTSLELTHGLNVLTGETGSGKSILIDGMLLALGARADKSLVRSGTKNASVEAVFLLPDDEELIIRREVSSKGRSRVFLNDALSTLDEVKQAVTQLVALHSQRSTPELLKSAKQLDILDRYANSEGMREQYLVLFSEWVVSSEKLKQLQRFLAESSASRVLLKHEIEIFDLLQPSLIDYNSLQGRRKEIKRVTELSSLFNEVLASLHGDTGVLDALSSILYKTQAEENNSELSELSELLMQASISVEEAINFSQGHLADNDETSEELREIDQRLDEYSKLISRCGGSIIVMLEYKDSLLEKLREFDKAEQELAELDKFLPELSEKLVKLAEALSLKRKSAALKFNRKAVSEMKLLNMPQVEFAVSFRSPASPVLVNSIELGTSGKESIRFLFSANPGIPVDSLDMVASGGELSRVALAIALTVADSSSSSTLVFDEIDSGTGGETAHSLAKSLLRASKNRQVIVISHLAQIASRANRHLAVTKKNKNGMPITKVVPLLDKKQQLAELARLLGGGDGAEQHAASLVSEFI